MPIIIGTTVNKITSFVIAGLSGRYLASRFNKKEDKPRQSVAARLLAVIASGPEHPLRRFVRPALEPSEYQFLYRHIPTLAIHAAQQQVY
jgi:hypothetical protein